MLLFEEREGSWKNAILGPHGRPSNLFGLNRASRAQGLEYAILLHQIDVWEDCGEATQACLDTMAVADTLVNPSPRRTLCGSVGIALQEPVPWAWNQSADSIDMPAKVSRIHIRCSKK